MTDLWKRPVSYGAVGATRAEDLLSFPPEGFRPVVRRVRIGHGDARFEFAGFEVMSWGIQRRAGFRVRVVEAPPEATEHAYIPVTFDADGGLIALEARHEHEMVSTDGTRLVVAGDTAWLSIPVFGVFDIKSPARVVYVLDEPNRKGFAYGTLAGHPIRGEESFAVERAADGSVWLTVTSFSRPAAWYWWIPYPVLRGFQSFYMRRYLRSLTGPLTAVSDELAPEEQRLY